MPRFILRALGAWMRRRKEKMKKMKTACAAHWVRTEFSEPMILSMSSCSSGKPIPAR